MRRTPWFPALLIPVLLIACGEGSGAPAGADQASEHEASGAEAIGFGESLAQIRGHHTVALELYDAGDRKAAAAHAGHPLTEVLDAVRGELEEHEPALATELTTTLEAAAEAIAAGRPVEEVSAATEDAAETTERALDVVVGEASRDSSYKGSVVASLLATSAHEYEEAVGDDGIRLVDEYEDAYGFLQEARSLYEEIAPDVHAASAEEAEEIEEAFATLDAAMPSAQPPADLVDKEEVEAAAELIGHELEETVGAAPLEESDPEEIVAEIEELLDEIVATYRDGDSAAAAELSAEAYLENYEVIEAEVIEQAPEVNEELEPLLGADLRRRLNEGAPVSEIEDMVAHAKELLAEALEAIEEH